MTKVDCYYKCFRCEKTFSQKGGIKTHLNRKKPCEWENKNLITSDEDVFKKSIEKHIFIQIDEKPEKSKTGFITTYDTIIKTSNVTNIINFNIDIDKKYVRDVLNRSFAPFFDGMNEDEDTKGYTYMYHFNDQLLDSLEKNKINIDDIADEMAELYPWSPLIPVDKHTAFVKVVEKINSIIYDIFMEIREEKISHLKIQDEICKYLENEIKIFDKMIEEYKSKKTEETK